MAVAALVAGVSPALHKGAPETLQKGGGETPRPKEMATEAPGAAQTPQTADLRRLNKFYFPPKVQPRKHLRRPKLFHPHDSQRQQSHQQLLTF